MCLSLHKLSIGNLVELLSVSEQCSLSGSELYMLSCDGPNRTSSTTITESPSHVILMESFSHSVTISSRMKKNDVKKSFNLQNDYKQLFVDKKCH